MDTMIPSIQTDVNRVKLSLVSVATIFTHFSFVTLSATDDGSGNKSTNDSGGERYQAYLRCISQVKASDSGTG